MTTFVVKKHQINTSIMSKIIYNTLRTKFLELKKASCDMVQGQVKICIDFDSEKEYDETLELLSKDFTCYKHNFEIAKGFNIMVLNDYTK